MKAQDLDDMDLEKQVNEYIVNKIFIEDLTGFACDVYKNGQSACKSCIFSRAEPIIGSPGDVFFKCNIDKFDDRLSKIFPEYYI